MAAQDSTKYFWMKMFTRFFDKHEIRILWGKNRDYVLLYIRLLLESVPNHGILKYNKNLSYSIEDIALLFDMPEDVVEKGIKELIKRELLIIDEDKTMFLPAAPAMSGFDTGLSLRLKESRRNKGSKEPDAGSNEPEMNPQTGSNDPRDKSIEYRDKSLDNKYNNPPVAPHDSDGSLSQVGETPYYVKEHTATTTNDHPITREELSVFIKKIKQNAPKIATPEIEESFWNYLVAADFRKGGKGNQRITKSNVHQTFKAWIEFREERLNKSEVAKKTETQDDMESKRRMEERAAYSLAHEIEEE